MLIQDRVKLIIKANNLSSSEFADQIGIKRSNLSHVLNGRNKPGLDFLSKVISSFPNVNASWLITGEQRDGSFEEKPEPDIVHTQMEVRRSESKSDNDREIDRIVVFYKDGTFSNYKPSA